MNHALAVRSHFSIGDSLLKIDDLVAQAKTLGYESLALTDNNSLHGMVEFTNACKKVGIKPIVGVTVNVHDDALYRKPPKSGKTAPKNSPFFSLKVYVLNEKGFTWLLKALSVANIPERYYYAPRFAIEDFDGAEGVAVSTGDFYGLFSRPDWKMKLDKLILELGRENVYAEVCTIDTPLFDRMNATAVRAMEDYTIPGIVTHPAHYGSRDDYEAHHAIGVMSTGGKLGQRWNSVQWAKNLHLHPVSDQKRLVIEAVARLDEHENCKRRVQHVMALQAFARGNKELASRVEFLFSKMPVNLPTMSTNEFGTLKTLCAVGWSARITKNILGYQPKAGQLTEYMDRLKFELGVIEKMNFSGYFLLAADIVNWSKSHGIIVGPGRGSVGGSLVAFLIGITDVDPIRFGLLFERFINPDRIDLPDADLDFMSSRRHEVIAYLQDKFGRDKVAGISNYSSMASASAVRDAGRIYDLSPLELTPMKLVPKEHGQPVTLTEAAKQVADIEAFSLKHPDVWKIGLKFEGVMRSFGQHAAGVVVSKDPIATRAVIETRTEMPVVCWDKSVVEDFGLVKLDILGLSTLDVLAIASQYIEQRHGKKINYLDIPIGEVDIMESFGRGDTTGVFQFESSGMRNLLRDLAKGGPLTFDDITAATALYRPGPMDSGLLEDFVNIKQGKQSPHYEHTNMQEALQDTYSVIVYQEQVMKVAVDLAGFTRTEADHLRKAMGKKDKAKMAEMRDKWLKGCETKSGMDAKNAGRLFDKIEAFAGYGFNKSHAVEYSIISYWTMWLRVRYPAEYFAACMSIVDQDKLPGLVRDARDYGIEIFPPDVNLSSEKFIIANDKIILAPFSSVLGISDTIAKKIVELRDAMPLKKFDSDAQFVTAASAPGTKVNTRVVERLRLVGSLANITPAETIGPRHPDRRKDQTELMPGLIIDVIKATKVIDINDGVTKPKIVGIVQDYAKCKDCSLAGKPHPMIRIPRSTIKYMVVSDCPSWQEEKAGRLLEGDGAEFVKLAIADAKLGVADGYYTTVVKSRKDDKFLTNEQLTGCKQFIERELDLLKPQVIVALGSAAIKFFAPDTKGGTADMAGKVMYDSKRGAQIVFGINPAQISFDPSKMDSLKSTFEKVAEIVL